VTNDRGDGPPEPATPRIIDGECGEVLDETNELLEDSSAADAETRAVRGFAKLCLHQSAGEDLDFAREHAAQLTPETRELLEAVVDAGEPRGDELRDVLRERSPP
jgi:hypothetical protein